MDYKNNKVVVGKKQILRALTENNVKSITIALDCDSEYAETIQHVAKLHNVQVERKGTMEQIASQYGIDVPSGAVAQLED